MVDKKLTAQMARTKATSTSTKSAASLLRRGATSKFVSGVEVARLETSSNAVRSGMELTIMSIVKDWMV